MPTVEPPTARILVTGANGYLGMWVVQTLLEQGYGVRAVVRSSEKGDRLKARFASFIDKLETIVVEDICKDGAFDEAVRDVDAIEHTASPATLQSEEPDDYIKPAIQGTLGILESARKYGDRIRRIIITSSVVAAHNGVAIPTTIFDETQWGDDAIKSVQEKGKEATALEKYSASKTLSERAAWEFYQEHKDEVHWDLVVLLPSFIFGPALQDVHKPEDLNESLHILWNMITKDMPESILAHTFSLVHVRDISAAHVRALRKKEAGGERIIIASDSLTWQGARNVLYSVKPLLYTSGKLPRGNPDLDCTILYRYNAEKGKRILGLEYSSTKVVLRDTVAYFEEMGWLTE